MINTLIIEDEKKSSAVLISLIAKHCPQLEVIGTADSVEEGVLQINKLNPELIFLDIQLSDGTGFDLLEKVQQINFDVVFATAYDQFAIKAIKYSAVDYLLKPIDPEELKLAVDKIAAKKFKNSGLDNLKFLLQNFKQSESGYNRITLPTGNAYEVVLVQDIIRCEANESYTKFYLTENRKFLVTQNLKNYEDLLPKSDFIRVHHHHLINMKHVIRFLKTDNGYVVMRDGSEIEVSRRKRDAFLESLNKL